MPQENAAPHCEQWLIYQRMLVRRTMQLAARLL
jgi:hypothetical protein